MALAEGLQRLGVHAGEFTARLVITISASDVPKAVNDSFSVRPGGTVTSNLSGNDRPSLDGGNVWTLASGPAHGSVTVNADGTFEFIFLKCFSL